MSPKSMPRKHISDYEIENKDIEIYRVKTILRHMDLAKKNAGQIVRMHSMAANADKEVEAFIRHINEGTKMAERIVSLFKG